MRLIRMFNKLNKLYFSNRLPLVDIHTSDRHVKVIQGYLSFNCNNSSDIPDKRIKPSITIYTCWKKEGQILFHECLHLFQWLNKESIRHTKQFKEIEKCFLRGDINGAKTILSNNRRRT